jgi:hypothetical protein
MSQIIIDVGANPNDGTGDPLRVAFTDINSNFTELYDAGVIGGNIGIANNSIFVKNSNGNLILTANAIGKVLFSSDAVPVAANTRYLGSSTLAWRGIYLGVDGVTSTGNISGAYILGNGSQLTGITSSGTSINSGTSNVKIVSANGNVTINIAGTSNVAAFSATGANITGLISASGNVTGGNLKATGNIFIGDTVFTRTLVVGTRTTPVTVALASNNSFLVGTRSSGNITVFTT